MPLTLVITWQAGFQVVSTNPQRSVFGGDYV